MTLDSGETNSFYQLYTPGIEQLFLSLLLVDKRLKGMVITPGQNESDSDEDLRNEPEEGK